MSDLTRIEVKVIAKMQRSGLLPERTTISDIRLEERMEGRQRRRTSLFRASLPARRPPTTGLFAHPPLAMNVPSLLRMSVSAHAVFVSLLAMFAGRSGVLLGLFLLAHRVVLLRRRSIR
jgi:hypothetical protein